MSDLGELVVVGGGEHARVVIDAARSMPHAWKILGYTDLVGNDETTRRFDTPYLGTDADVLQRMHGRDVFYVLGVGATGVSDHRARVARVYEAAEARFASVVHASSWLSSTAQVDPGAVVMAGALVNTGARVGAHAVLNTGAIVEHDVTIGAHAIVGPGAVIGGRASVGEGSYVGLGSCVRDHVRVGKRVLIGMGAVVVRDTGDDVVLVGVPARPRGTRASG